MATALVKDIEFLQKYGFSEKQAEGILSVTESRAKQIEEKAVTKEYLELKFEKMKNYFIIQAVGIVLASLGLLGWHINYLDNKNRAYVKARFSEFKDNNNARFEGIEARFDKIESDLKDIKNFIFSRFSAIEKKPTTQ